jgi:cobalt-zinc-cadmium efflux system outer membrane protein
MRARCRPDLASVWGTLVLGVLTGCVGYQPAPLELQRSADQFAARRIDAVELRDELKRLLPQAVTSWPPQQWDRSELFAVALLRNPQLSISQAEVDAALAHQVTAAEMPNPDLTLQSEYSRQEMHPWLYGLSLNWLLPTQRLRLRQETARLVTLNTRLKLMEQAWAIRRELVAALSDWEGARRRLTLLQELAAAQDRLIVLEQERVNAGEDPPSEFVTAGQVRIEIEQQLSEVRAAAEVAEASAARALGFSPQTLDGVTFTWPEWGAPPAVAAEVCRGARERALLSRADLGVAIGEYAIAEAGLKLAVARQYPQLTLGPGYYWDHGIAKFPLDLGFTLPVNRNEGEIAEARAARELAGKRLLALQADIFGEIAAAERAEVSARASTDSAEGQLETARRQAGRVDLSLRLGASDLREQVGAQVLTLRAELEVLESHSRLQAARNNLEDVLHAPLSGPELALADYSNWESAGAGS